MQTRIMYLRESYYPKSTPIGCVAIKLDGNNIKYSISAAAPCDPFVKTIAKDIALGRLEKENTGESIHNYSITYETDRPNMNEITKVVMSHISNNSPSVRARNAANDWLLGE